VTQFDGPSEEGMKLWKRFHRFFLNDVIYHRYEESSNEEYYSFVSLWRYTDENGFLDRLFQTSWNKFLHFYIRLLRPHYSHAAIEQELTRFEQVIGRDLEEGRFSYPQSYEEVLDYLILLLNMCFETHTFKTLINGKMLFFRDNNKMKNELLEEKKSHESSLWELKEADKGFLKREKKARKALKKEIKTHSQGAQEAQREVEEITEQRTTIASRKLFYNQKIIDIDNQIYELCCLPEFSNVWLLGEDRHRNLFWVALTSLSLSASTMRPSTGRTTSLASGRPSEAPTSNSCTSASTPRASGSAAFSKRYSTTSSWATSRPARVLPSWRWSPSRRSPAVRGRGWRKRARGWML
jgi:hypothetical protein